MLSANYPFTLVLKGPQSSPWLYTLVTFDFFFVLKAPITIKLCGESTVLQS